jgi:AraC-like DNA-binding protein
VILVRRGVFQRRVAGVGMVADTATGYLQRPGDVQQFAHPAGGDCCTSIRVPDDVADRLWAGSGVAVSPPADLAHRRLLSGAAAAAHAGVLADLTHELLAELTPATRVGPTARRAAEQVRAALAADLDQDLAALAAAVGCSPWYLCRLFRSATGTTITGYRGQLRVRAVLDELARAGGRPVSLAELAAAHGYADQAHLTRAVRRHTGLPPAALRERHLRW